jgi:hypothetical protein
MGGSGSTRWHGHRLHRCVGKGTVAVRLKSLAQLLRCPDGTEGITKRPKIGTLRFSIFTIPRKAEMTTRDRVLLERRISISIYDEAVGSVLARGKRAPFGGVRWWLLCYTCRKCRNQLFLVDERFWRCRVCLGLKYVSQRLNPLDRLQYRGAKIMKRAGGGQTWRPGEVPWKKPKGMHWRTFANYQRQVRSIDARRNSAFVGASAHFLSRAIVSQRELASIFGDSTGNSLFSERRR